MSDYACHLDKQIWPLILMGVNHDIELHDWSPIIANRLKYQTRIGTTKERVVSRILINDSDIIHLSTLEEFIVTDPGVIPIITR